MLKFQKTAFQTETGVIINSSAAQRSTTTTDNPSITDGCLFTLDENCYVVCSIPGAITTGDTVYESDNTTLFNGNDLYYNVKLNASSSTSVCQINNVGVVGVYELCGI